MTTQEISRDTGINHQAITRKFPQYVGKELTDEEIAEILEYYMRSPRIDGERKEQIKMLIPAEPQGRERIDIEWRYYVYLACVLLLISIQAWHFSQVAADAAMSAGRPVHWWVDFLMGFLFESVAILITVDRVALDTEEHNNKQGWLWFFAILAFVTNSVYYHLWTELSLYMTAGKLMASLALPVAILAFSHLFNKSYK